MVMHVRESKLPALGAEVGFVGETPAGAKAVSASELFPRDRGRFVYDYLEFLPGCSITALTFEPQEEMVVDIAPIDGVSLSCVMTGVMDTRPNWSSDPIRFDDKYNLLSGPRSSGVPPAHVAAGEQNRLVRLLLSKDMFCQWATYAGVRIDEFALLDADTEKSNVIAQVLRSPDLQMVLSQIINAPVEGPLRSSYLHGKSLELVSLFFRDFSDSTNPVKSSRKIGPAEQYRLQKAMDVLLADLADAPTIPQLAEQVRLSETALKSGFKKLFGSTVHSFLHQHRLERARELLKTGEYNVLAVAVEVGWTCPSRFALSFKRRFGVSPGAYRRHCANTDDQAVALDDDTMATLTRSSRQQ